MRCINIAVGLGHGQRALQALAEAVENADGSPSLQRTLATPARDRAGRAYTVEVVLRVERFDDG